MLRTLKEIYEMWKADKEPRAYTVIIKKYLPDANIVEIVKAGDQILFNIGELEADPTQIEKISQSLSQEVELYYGLRGNWLIVKGETLDGSQN